MVPDVPEVAAIIKERHNNIVQRVVKGFKKLGSILYIP
jgi:hypothetical protein